METRLLSALRFLSCVSILHSAEQHNAMNINVAKLDLFFNDYAYYMGRKFDQPTLQHIFRHHPNASYVVSKYTNQPDFHEFLVHSDAITAGCLFSQVAVCGSLPPHYLNFLRWFKFEYQYEPWNGVTPYEKEIFFAEYVASLPVYPENDIVASLYPV